MNGPPSDGSESTVDIFVLSKNQTEVPVRMAPLEQKGYRVTFFDDPPTLVETLHNGKPNLLICDTLSFPEAYDLCRHVKDDNDLWVIPVLILTGASDLSDLLHILDCNADNYLAYPYDPDYFLSLIEGMLATPVERQTPDQIKTQFKIQHDDRIFVVTADRRKLLEFLLSSFEIAVSKIQDLSRANDEIHVLSDDVKRLGMFVDGQKQTIDELESSLRKGDQENKILEETRRENEQALLDKTSEIERLTRDLEADTTLLGAAEDQLRTLIRNKEESERQSVAEIADLRTQVTSLLADLTGAQAALQESRDAHTLEKSGRTEALASLAETAQGKDLAERTSRALTLENEQMKISLAAEKNRASAAEQEIRSILLAKSESEQDLTAIINGLKETAKQQASDLQQQKTEMDDGKNRILNLGIHLGNLKKEKEKAESDLQAITDRLQQDLARVREKLDAAEATLDEKDLEIERLNVAYNDILDERTSAGSELQATSQELLDTRKALVEKRDEIERLTVSCNGLLEERTRTASELQATTRELLDTRNALVEKGDEIERLTVSCNGLLEERTRAASELQTASHALEDERERHHAADQNLVAAIRERDAALQSLQDSHQSVQADLAEHRDNLAEARRDLASASASRSTLERDLEAALSRVRDLESGMQGETARRDQAVQQVRSLSDELEGAKAALENERRLHYATAGSLRSAVLGKERYEEEIRKLSDQLASAQSSLTAEKELRTAGVSAMEDLHSKFMAAENKARSQEVSIAAAIEAQAAELLSASRRQQELESRVRVLAQEKQLAEERAASLAAEIDQARTALADEWEDHMNDHERLTVAVQEKQQLEQSLTQPDMPETEKAGKRSLIIKSPDLPMEIGVVSRALTTPVTPADPHSDPKRIIGVEDLFEDDGAAGEPEPAPMVSIIQEPSGNPDWAPPIESLLQDTDEIMSPTPGDDVAAEDGATGKEEDEQTGAGDEYPDADETGEDAAGDPGEAGYSAGGIPTGISFNRAQWFDLLKWAHHSGSLTPEQRMQIVRMGRLIQKGRKLTRKQDDQVREMIVLVQALGYRFT
jgi:DNA-binding response OmpR family regulator/predicted  nucleic acid-binding Zn-ribbon protein